MTPSRDRHPHPPGAACRAPFAGPRRYTGHVDATPLLSEVARRLNDVHLEAVLIGNAGAALQGAPVTTVDFDFLYRKTPRNLIKLKRVADALQAVILRPYYPASDLYRVVPTRVGAYRPQAWADSGHVRGRVPKSETPPRVWADLTR